MEEKKTLQNDNLSEEDLHIISGGSIAGQLTPDGSDNSPAFEGKNEPGNNDDIYSSNKKISIL